MKENGARLFRGLVFYILIFNISALCCVLFFELLWFFTPGTAQGVWRSREGIISIFTVTVSGILSWLYYSLENKNHDLYCTAANPAEGIYQGPCPLKSIVFKKGRRIGAGTAACFMAFTVLAQEAAFLFGRFLEIILNIYGYTSMYAPAAGFDYTSSPAAMIYAVLAAPLAEEIMYRGLILRGLEQYGRNFAVTVSAAVFCLMHGDVTQIFFTFLMGLMLGAAAIEYGILWSFLLHVFNNAVYSGALIVLSVFLTESAMEVFMIMLVIISAAVITIWIIRRHKELGAFIREGRGSRGNAAVIINIWSILFAVYEILEVSSTVTRL